MLSGYWNNSVGCSIMTLAELIGDTPKVAFDHHGKEWALDYQDWPGNSAQRPHSSATLDKRSVNGPTFALNLSRASDQSLLFDRQCRGRVPACESF